VLPRERVKAERLLGAPSWRISPAFASFISLSFFATAQAISSATLAKRSIDPRPGAGGGRGDHGGTSFRKPHARGGAWCLRHRNLGTCQGVTVRLLPACGDPFWGAVEAGSSEGCLGASLLYRR
jgi:hypothetical protein